MPQYDEQILNLERAKQKVQSDKGLDQKTKDRLVAQFLKDIQKRKEDLGDKWNPGNLI